ncbi:MAG: type II toxin-antitoxin system VapC family toxin [Pseudonocardiaceae bacterium]
MSLDRVLLDSAVFIYSVGVAHPYRDPCRQLLKALEAEQYRGEASALAIEETLHQRTRRTGDRESAQRVARSVMTLCPVHDLTTADVVLGLRLFRTSERLNTRDVLHAATALNRNIPVIISPDKAFDDVPQLERIDPVQAVAQL